MHILNIGDFVMGCVFDMLTLYFLLGFFFKAPWLHTDGRRRDGRWVVISQSYYERTALFLLSSALSGTNFDSAFHGQTAGRDFLIVLGSGICSAVLLWLERSAKKKA